MRASFALLPALAAMAMARCSSRATSTLTSAVVSSPTSSADPTSSAVSTIESTTTTTSDEHTTTESSTLEPSTTEPATSEPPTTTELPTTSELPTTTDAPTTTEAPTTTTEEHTTTSIDIPTSTAPTSAPTVTGFCLKAITPAVANYNYHIRAVSLNTNLVTEAPTGSGFGLFDLDLSTGKMSISGGTYAGYEVYPPPPFDNQQLRVLRFTNAAVQYPLICSNPDGVYTTGSVLKCAVSAPWADGVTRRYSLFNAPNSSPAGAWSIMNEAYVRAGSYNYDVGMFFGDDCTAVAAP
jgi:hypothetical protein